MRYLIMILLITCACSSLQAQVNYVRNPSFEQHTQCPYYWNQVKFANYWSAIDSNWEKVDTFSNAYCSPDYCNVCGDTISFFASIPFNGAFYQYPHTGNGMMQVNMYFDNGYQGELNQRDYLQGRLSKKLITGKSYCVTFYVNLEEASQYAINRIGAYLDDGKIDTTHNCGLPQTQYTPQVYANEVITDTLNWTRIQGGVIANGNERFITIGNFFSKANTTADTVPFYPKLGYNNFAFYLIDDVSVIESDLEADAGPDKGVRLGDSVFIGRTPEVGLECKWYNNGIMIDSSGAGIWVKPQQSTTYMVAQTLCGLVKYDKVHVEVWPLGIPSVSNYYSHQYSLYPNPNNGEMQLTQALPDEEPVLVEVKSLLGITLSKNTLFFKGGTATLNAGNVTPGMYLLQLRDAGGNAYTLKFIVK